MMADDFEYDVAFSFHALDEGLATQLNDLLSDRMKTFIYSERQREIAGSDGQQKFSEVYGKTARIVVILYRPEWGETPWTRVEQEAIRNRAFSDSWDFTVFIPTAPNPQMPPWLPKTRLYVGLERFGIESAAGVIESRVTERGGEAQQETVTDRAARFARAAKLKDMKREFQKSHVGVNASKKAYEDFSVALETLAASTNLKSQRSHQFRIVSGISPINLIADFHPVYSNVLDDAKLRLDYFKGFPQLPGFWSHGGATKLRGFSFTYELLSSDRSGWVAKDAQHREFTPEQLADYAVKLYFDVAEKNPLRY
jgi:hypothetical protein